jgi:transglutaminase-like putative cysteine protease
MRIACWMKRSSKSSPMAIEQAFRFSAVLLAASAFAGLVLAHAVPLWLAILTGIILSLTLLQAAGVATYRDAVAEMRLPPVIWSLLLITALIGFVLDLFFLSRELLPAGIHFLVILLTVKLVSLRERRDFRHLYAISLMAILASAALTTDVWYVPIFLLYLLAAVWTLLLYHLTDNARQATTANNTDTALMPIHRITSRFFWFTNGMALLTFGLTLLIFFIMPRVTTGWVHKSQSAGLRTTGFSERVDLGTIGSIKQDPSIVMRVELPDHPTDRREPLYLRGTAYNYYDGRAWNASLAYRRPLTVTAEGTFVVRSGGTRPTGYPPFLLRQDILLESLDTSILFAAPTAESISGEFPAVQADTMGGLHLPFPSTSRIRYSVTSQARQMMPDEQSAPKLDYPEAILRHFLQVPRVSDQVADLAQNVAGKAETPYGKVLAIQQHLTQSYRYSLDVETSTVEHPLEDFLFIRKTGYCEHYATAMVILLRIVGIPARLVTGFLAMEWNEFGGYYTVRQQDAHAWVEVFFPRSGWITMDPTPTVGTSAPGSRWEVLHRLIETSRLHWDRLFVRYSAADQVALVHGIRQGGDILRDHLGSLFSNLLSPLAHLVATLTPNLRSSHQGILEFLGVVALLSLVLLAAKMWRNSQWGTATRNGNARRYQAIVRLYVQMIRLAEREGISRTASITPTEFVQQVHHRCASAGPVVAGFIELYCRARFSRHSLTPQEFARAIEYANRVRRILRMS